ncbi:MAG: cupin [Pseudomonadota bacterium]
MSQARIIRSREFIAQRAWDALDIAVVEGASVRLHWTDQPYVWHINEGSEVFVVLDGVVQMFYREAGDEHSVSLRSGDIFHARVGCEHVAHPQGAARILVIEKVGSV